MDAVLRQLARISLRPASCAFNASSFHSCTARLAPYEKPAGPVKWPSYNKKIFPPQKVEDERRPAFICHLRKNIKYSPWKMWYIASMIRGMSIDEALKQLSFVDKQGAVHVRQVLLEAQQLAVEQHNVEYKSNLWVAESFVGKGVVIKGVRRHARMRMGVVHYFHCHYFVRLEEGPPPEHYYLDKKPQNTKEMLEGWLADMRKRRIPGSL